METINERAESTAQWIIRRAPQLKNVHLKELIAAELVKQQKIDEAKYKKLRTLAYDMYTSAQYLSTDASKLRKAMDAFKQYVCYEEEKEE